MSVEVIVLGGGASGLIASIMAARSGAVVTLLEQNERPGKKLLASGNGKCNLTNLDMGPSHYHGGASERVARVLSKFDAVAALAFFYELGLEVFDRDGWVYPVTEQSSSVCELLLMEAARLAVKCKYSERVIRVEKTEDGFFAHTGGWKYRGDALIIACGSPASSVRGASDDALMFAKQLGIATAPFRPALVPLRARVPFLSAWAGVRANAEGILWIDGQEIARTSGEFQFTEHGVSGIPVMQISHLAERAAACGRSTELRIDLVPRLSVKELTERLLSIAEAFPAREVSQLFTGILPGKLISLVCAGIRAREDDDISAVCADLARAAKEFRVSISGTGPLSQAQVCSGGILLDDLTDDLQSRVMPGLFACGECVDVVGDCGGYNLQWAWSSGAVAGGRAAGAAR